jgi:hypothetical protein
VSASRLNRGDLVAALSAVLLVVSMFAFAWFGFDGLPGRGSLGSAVASAEDAWHGLSVIRWLMTLTIAAAIGSVVIHVRPVSRQLVAAARLTVLTLGVVSFVLVAYRVLIALPTPDRVVDQKLGAFLGTIWALGIALGGYESVREQRARLRSSRPASTPPEDLASAGGELASSRRTG